jgi:hypothetical protein
MKKFFFTLFVLFNIQTNALQAQLANGSTAPDFTVTDVNGNSHNLYTLLNQGKTVYIDFFATWCGICWNYHQTHALEDIWTQHGPGGTNDAFVISIEGDANTSLGCITAASCTGGTQGNWTTGITYPICDNSTVNSQYQVPGFPTIYCICPNKKIYNIGRLNATQLWAARATNCSTTPAAIVASLASTSNVKCKNTNTGAINLSVSGGTGTYSYLWNSGQTTQNLVNIAAGSYTCTITSGTASTTIGPVVINAPSAALLANITVNSPLTCVGSGSLTAFGTGGWGGYQYDWGANQTTANISAPSTGSYNVVITDANGCSAVVSESILSPIPPSASIAPTSGINCTNSQVTLNGAASTSGANIGYQWTTVGGVIVSGATTNTAKVSAVGQYTLRVTNTNNGCTSTANVQVTSNLTQPTTVASASNTITCNNPTTTVSATSSAFAPMYAWSGPNGFTSSLASFPVNMAGNYQVIITNPNNGCTAMSNVLVNANTTLPTVTATVQNILGCSVTSTTIEANSTTPNLIYAWSGPNGFTANTTAPSVSNAGTYRVTVTDPTNGCTAWASTQVLSQAAVPVVTTFGGILNCSHPSVTVSANSSIVTSEYTWTGPGGFASNSNSFTATIAGTYTVIVTNTINGCSSSATAIVTQSPAVSLTLQAQQILCNGNTGSLTANPIGGIGAYTYLWSNGANTPSINNILAGNYRLTISDTEGCTAWAAMNLNQPTALACNATGVPQSAIGMNNGALNANPTGGVLPYSYLWNTNATTQNIQNVAPGQYRLTISDANGCTAWQAVTVAAFNCNIDVLLSAQNNVTCNGGNNGRASISITNALPNYSINWSNGQTGPSLFAFGLTAGNYTVSVSDASGCQDVESFSITEPAPLVLTTVSTPQTVVGINNGTASAIVQGSSATYNYVWSNGATGQSILNLAPGTYSVIAQDAINGCSATQTVSVAAANCFLTASVQTTATSCLGGNNGTAALNVENSNGNLYILWNTGSTNTQITNLAAGFYSVTVSDATACQVIQNFEITQPSSTFNISILLQTNTTCTTANNGAATVLAIGGDFMFTWSNGSTGNAVTGLSANTYTVTATSSLGCTATKTVQILAIDNIAPTIICPANMVRCASQNTQVLPIPTVSDNCSTVLPLQSNAPTTLPQGINTIVYTTKDEASNTSTCSFTIEISSPIVVANTANTGCFQNCQGEIALQGLTGGTAPYTFLWSNAQTTQTAKNLCGSNGLTVNCIDSNQCITLFTIPSIPLPDVLTANLGVVENASNNLNNGSIEAIVLGGTPPYTFLWKKNGTAYATTQNLIGLSFGDYLLQATDANGCTAQLPSIIVQNIVGTNVTNLGNFIKMYPNPSNGQFSILLSDKIVGTLQVKIVDLQGKVLYNILESDKNNIDIDLSNIASGMYWVIMTNQNYEILTKKIVKY